MSDDDDSSIDNDAIERDVNILSSPPFKRPSKKEGTEREDVSCPLGPSGTTVAKSHGTNASGGGASKPARGSSGNISSGARSSSADDANTGIVGRRGEDGQVDLAESADSATLRAAFADSPANQRR